MYEIYYFVIGLWVISGAYLLWLDHQKRVKDEREKEAMKRRIEELEKEKAK